MIDRVVMVVCVAVTLGALIAAMRCYVASCLGDDVELPEELDIN